MVRDLAQRLLGDYALYRVYRSGPDRLPALDTPPGFAPIADLGEFDRAGDRQIAALRSYAGPGSHGFGAWSDGRLAAVCWYWDRERDRQADTWPTGAGEAKLAQIVTADKYRGRGLATRLIAYSTGAMQARGFATLHARIWHSNHPSNNAFEKAGWSYVAFVVQMAPPAFGRALRIVLPPIRMAFRGRRP